MGFIDATGELVIPYDFHASATGPFNTDGFALAQPLGQDTKVVIERQFYFVWNVSNGLAQVAPTAEDSDQNLETYINTAGDIVAKSQSHL